MVQSSRKVKLSQLRIRLCDLLIEIKETDTNIKLKTVKTLAKNNRTALVAAPGTHHLSTPKNRIIIILPQEKKYQDQREIPRRKIQRHHQIRKLIGREEASSPQRQKNQNNEPNTYASSAPNQ